MDLTMEPTCDSVLPHMCSYIGPYAYGTYGTRMGYPVRVWANIKSHTRMGVPYEYACMIIRSILHVGPGLLCSKFCLLCF